MGRHDVSKGWSFPRALCGLVLGLGLVSSARATDEQPPWVLYRLEGREAHDRLGASFVALGDVDGDGLPDYAVRAVESGGKIRGRIEIRSGPDGRIIREITSGLETSAGYGRSMASGGDLDHDGIPDLLIQGNFFIDAVSVGTGERLWRREHWKYGHHSLGLLIVSDVDGDSEPDYIVGNHEEYESEFGGLFPDRHGRVTLHSGRTHEVIWDIRGKREDDYFGSSVFRIGDVDGDGIEDLSVPASRRLLHLEHSPDPEEIHFVSGATGEEIHRFSLGIPACGLWGASVLGDIDGDDIEDFLMSAWNAPVRGFAGGGWVFAVSGRTFEILWRTTGQDFDHYEVFGRSFFGDRFGANMAVVDDLDGDSIADVLVLSPRYLFGANDDFRVHVLSGATGRLNAVLEAESAGTEFGLALSALGDVNGDGAPEVLIGTPYWDRYGASTAADIGTVHVLSFLPDSRAFVRGDADLDGRIWLTDAVFVLRYLFEAGESPCLEAMDQNHNGHVSVADAIILCQHLFQAGPAPMAPYPDCAYLLSFDERLPCERSGCP